MDNSSSSRSQRQTHNFKNPIKTQQPDSIDTMATLIVAEKFSQDFDNPEVREAFMKKVQQRVEEYTHLGKPLPRIHINSKELEPEHG